MKGNISISGATVTPVGALSRLQFKKLLDLIAINNIFVPYTCT